MDSPDQGHGQSDPSGGTAEPLTTLDEARGETTHRWPHFLPDGGHYLYLAAGHGTDVLSGENVIYLAALDSDERRILLHARSQVLYANGHLLYQRGRDVVAHPFDPDTLELTGDPYPVAEGVRYEKGFFQGVFAVSQNGILAFQRGGQEQLVELVWVDRDGRELGRLDDPSHFGQFRISPDGAYVAVAIGDTSDLWLFDLARDTKTPLTSEQLDEFGQVWSPDGSTIVYASGVGHEHDLVRLSVRSGESQKLVDLGQGSSVPTDWSSAAGVLAFGLEESEESSDLWMLPMEDGAEPYAFLDSEAYEHDAVFSPDGRFVAYSAGPEMWRREIYVTPFPGKKQKWKVSHDGGYIPRWGADGRELFYQSDDGMVVAVPVSTDPEFNVGDPQALFRAREWYDATADGQRFLISRALRSDEPITLVVGWLPR